MKDLVLNFSWAKFVALPPTEMLALVVMAFVAVFLCLLVFGLILHVIANIWLFLTDVPIKKKG